MSNPVYKNAMRSKKMIKESFLELISQKNISKIKIKEIIAMADISKGTFYAHYEDVYDVLEEIENENIKNMIDYLSKTPREPLVNDFLPFINKIFDHIEENRNIYLKLIHSNASLTFLSKMQNVFLDYMMQDKEILSKLKDQITAKQFFSYTSVGIVSIIYQYYTAENILSLKNIKGTLNNYILYGIFAIKKP